MVTMLMRNKKEMLVKMIATTISKNPKRLTLKRKLDHW